MLEDAVTKLLYQDEEMITGLLVLVSVLGFAASLYINREGRSKMRRAPYFLAFSFVIFGYGLLSLGWIFTSDALVSGSLWVLFATVLSASFGLGYYQGQISRERSLSIGKSGRFAWFAFIPIANLYLFFKGPSTPIHGRKITGRIGDVLMIVVGIIAISMGHVISEQAESASEARTDKIMSDPETQDFALKNMINIVGIEKTIEQMASEVAYSRIDNITELERAEADGAELRYIYTVETDAASLGFEFGQGLISRNCEIDSLKALFQNGGTIRHIYMRANGTELDTVTVNQKICDAPPPVISEAPKPTPEQMAIAALSEGPGAKLYSALLKYYPYEADFMRTSLVNIMEGDEVSVDSAFAKMTMIGAQIRQRHAGGLKNAPDQALVSLLQSTTQIIAAFEDRPELCNRIILFGSGAVPQEEAGNVVALIDDVDLLYRTMYEGENNPAQRGPAQEEDWVNFFESFFAMGGTDAEIDLIFEPNIQKPELCPAMLKYLRVMINADFPGADRIRAESVAAMNEG